VRRTAAVVFAALIGFGTVAPAAAVEPTASSEPSADVASTASPPAATATPAVPTPSEAPSSPSGAPSVGEVPGEAPASPTAVPTPSPTTAPDAGRLSAAGRYIVLLVNGADTAAVVERHRKQDGTRATSTFKRAIRGFAARLDARQLKALKADRQVKAIVPDDVIQVTAQTIPTGVSRVSATQSSVARIDGVDTRVDADVAIVDTGVGPHSDLNIVGGYNCSTTARSRWYDENGHGTHVAGTVAAIDNGFGVVGVAPGARIWSVRILNADGFGYLSWYVCGLDWILGQKDPADPSRPLIEAVNMSVAKTGTDDGHCGTTNNDILHQGICRLYAGGITVVAAAANASKSAAGYVPAAYNEVITVSALADTDGKSGGLGGHRCYSWGTYDQDDTFADFSNYGSDVDLIAPGKCIWSTLPNGSYGYLSGTSMAAPAVTGAVALYKASRPLATPAEVRESLRYLGNSNWYTSTDPDGTHEPLLGVSHLGALGTFSLDTDGYPVPVATTGGVLDAPFIVTRSATFFERVNLTVTDVPTGWSATVSPSNLFGWTASQGSLRVTVPSGTRTGTYYLRVTGTNWGRIHSTTVAIQVATDVPTARPATATAAVGTVVGVTGGMTMAVRANWPAATDPAHAIVAYEIQRSIDGGLWGGTVGTSATVRTATFADVRLQSTIRPRVRARDSAGAWSAWSESPNYMTVIVSDRSGSVSYSGSWGRGTVASAVGGTLTSTRYAGSYARHRFVGRAIGIVAPTSTTRGKARIYLDGVLKATIDLGTTSTPRRVVYAASWAASGTHTIELRALGTAGRPLVSLDALVILK
jgi:subtilisin family serine protease